MATTRRSAAGTRAVAMASSSGPGFRVRVDYVKYDIGVGEGLDRDFPET